jgi:hypothetical protein
MVVCPLRVATRNGLALGLWVSSRSRCPWHLMAGLPGQLKDVRRVSTVGCTDPNFQLSNAMRVGFGFAAVV